MLKLPTRKNCADQKKKEEEEIRMSSNKTKNGILTSFLSKGMRNGSLTLSPATTVITGSRQLKIAPNMSIFPSLGSTGSIDRRRPVKHQITISFRFQNYVTRRQLQYHEKDCHNNNDTTSSPRTVRFSSSSKAPMIFKYSTAF